jgi:hypothetical protein
LQVGQIRAGTPLRREKKNGGERKGENSFHDNPWCGGTVNQVCALGPKTQPQVAAG